MATTVHETRIVSEYIPAEALHRWHFECSCGARGDGRLSPRQAERDADKHSGADRELS